MSQTLKRRAYFIISSHYFLLLSQMSVISMLKKVKNVIVAEIES
jgi:hypothetical protein